MTDEFSINDVNRKRSRKQGDVLDDLRNIDHGEAAWDLGDREERPDRDDAAGKDDKKSGKNDEMSMFAGMPGFGDDEEPEKPSSLDIIRLLRGVWGKRNMVVIITLLSTTLFAGLAFTLLHHQWQAHVVLLKKERLDQFQIGSTGAPYEQQNYSLKTMLDTLKLPSILIETISKSAIDVTPRQLSSSIDLSLGKESNIFTISVKWDDARQAENIANLLVDEFIRRNVQMRREDAMEIYEYYGAQLAKAEANFKEVYDKLLNFQNKNGVVNFDSQTEVLLTKVADLEVEYRTNVAELEVDEKGYTRLTNTLNETPEMVVGQSVYRSPLKNKLNELEWQLEQARGRYTDKNPKVSDLLEQVNSLKKLIDEGKDDNTPEQIMAVNPVRQELEIKKIDLEDAIKLKQARIHSIQENIDRLNEKLSSMTEKQKEYFQLVAEKDSISGVIENLKNRVEESRVIMLSGNGDFEIVEPARVPEEPESSGRKLVVIAGFVLGGGAGLFFALLMEFLSPLVMTRKEVIGITRLDTVFEFQHVPFNEQEVIDVKHPNEPTAMIFRRLLNDLSAVIEEKALQSVAFVSADRESGRSLIVTNLAQTLSMRERRCLIVDADLAHDAGTRIAEYYEVENTEKNVENILKQECRLNESIIRTESPNVSLLPAFDSRNAGEHSELLLGSRRMSSLVKALRNFPGSVFYDLPPLIRYETAYEATAEIGSAILIVRSGVCRKQEIEKIVERMKSSNVDIIAIIVTDVPSDLMSGSLQFKAVKPEKIKKS
jgi:succinoglycan biosynthesis transport protein ExoP